MSGWAGVMRLGGVGDDLIVSSVLPFLRHKFGKVEVITKAPWHVVFENNPHIDKLSVWAEDTDPKLAPSAFNREIDRRAKEYDFFINLTHSVEASLAFFESQSQFWWPVEARRAVADRSYLEYVHTLCGDTSENYQPRFYPTDEEMERAATTRRVLGGDKRPLVGWCVSGSRLDKTYPHSHRAIARILKETGAGVVMFGAKGRDAALAQQINEEVQAQNSGLEGLHAAIQDGDKGTPWDLRRSLSLLRLCDAVVAPDTGLAWSVAVEDIPKIVMVSHASAKNITHGWRNTVTLHADPERVTCWPCHRLNDQIDTCTKAAKYDAAACMADIPVESVVSAVRKALATHVEVENEHAFV